jgi:hypothetical protein
MAYPNPSNHYFRIAVKSGWPTELNIKIYDALGRLIGGLKNVPVTGNFIIGAQYRPGAYYVEVLQGSERKILKFS